MATRYKVTPNTELIKAIEINAQQLVGRIFQIDSLIENYAYQLNRAQPLLSGKVCLNFVSDFSHTFENKKVYSKKPIWGRLVKKKSGPWLFRFFNRKENFEMRKFSTDAEKIQNFRVGRNFKSDYTVRRLIARICDLMTQREEILSIVSQMRASLYQVGRKSDSMIYDYFEELSVIEKNINMDWLNNAHECYQALSKEVKKATDMSFDAEEEGQSEEKPIEKSSDF